MSLSGVPLENYGKKIRPTGVDFVDVAALGIEGFPFAAAGLGMDGSIHLIRDLLTDKAAKMIHFNLSGERAYRILCAEGHIFVLTDTTLYGFVDLAKSFLDHKPLDRLMITRKLDLEAVDISLPDEHSLFVVMPENVLRIEIEPFISRNNSASNEPITASRSSVSKRGVILTTVDEPMEFLSETAWSHSEEFELSKVA